MTLYYGLYARQYSAKLYKVAQPILVSFGYAPFNCPECSHEMLLAEVYYGHHRVSLQDLYEQKMAKTKYHSV